MRTYRVIIHEDAESELAEAYEHIAADSPENAARWKAGLLKKAKSLRRFPFRCHTAPEAAIFGRDIRHLIQGEYRIIFLVEADTVTVLHIRHGARLPVGASASED